MDIRNMRQILAIRAHGSFAKAAQELGISQPSLSAAMARLEDQLGVKLFHRGPGGSQLTPIGELISERASKVLAETEAIVRDAELVAGGEAGFLRVGVGTALRPNFLPNFVQTIAVRHPGLRLDIEVLDRDRLVPLLKSRELDLIVCALDGKGTEDGLVVTPIMSTKVVAVASPTHPLMEKDFVNIARFVEYPSGGSNLSEFTNAEILAVRECDGSVSQYTANDYEPLLTLALSGACTLIAPFFVVQPQIEAGRLAPLNLDWGLSVVFAAKTTRASNYSPMVRRAVEYAAEVGKTVGRPRGQPNW